MCSEVVTPAVDGDILPINFKVDNGRLPIDFKGVDVPAEDREIAKKIREYISKKELLSDQEMHVVEAILLTLSIEDRFKIFRNMVTLYKKEDGEYNNIATLLAGVQSEKKAGLFWLKLIATRPNLLQLPLCREVFKDLSPEAILYYLKHIAKMDNPVRRIGGFSESEMNTIIFLLQSVNRQFLLDGIVSALGYFPNEIFRDPTPSSLNDEERLRKLVQLCETSGSLTKLIKAISEKDEVFGDEASEFIS